MSTQVPTFTNGITIEMNFEMIEFYKMKDLWIN